METSGTTTIMIDANYLKTHRTASSLRVKKGERSPDRTTKGSMNTKLHAVCDSKGRPIDFFVPAGQVSDYIGARALLSSLPNVDWLLGDRGYDADWFRESLKDKGSRVAKERFCLWQAAEQDPCAGVIVDLAMRSWTAIAAVPLHQR